MTSAPDRTIASPSEIRPLLDAIRARMNPDSIWLFGSRARGDANAASDWDLCVALPDDADPALLDPLVSWELARDSGVPVTIVTTSSSELGGSWGAINTRGYELARDARRIED